MEDHPDKKIHVFNSFTSIGKTDRNEDTECEEAGMSFGKVVSTVGVY